MLARPAPGVLAPWYDMGEDVQTAVLRRLGKGDLAGVRTLVAGVPEGEGGLVLRLAAADVDVQSQAGDVLVLEALRDETEAAAKRGERDYSLWVQALLAEYFFWRGDALSYVISDGALATAPAEPLPAPLLAARGRLHRVKGVGMLLAGDPGVMAAADAEIAAAVDDLGRAGWDEQQAITAGVATYMRVAGYWDGLDPAQHVLTETCDRLVAINSQYAALAFYGLAHAAFIRGDLAAVHDALRRCDELPSPFPVELGVLVRYVRAVAQVIGEAGSAGSLAGLAAVADEFRRDFPQVLGSACVTVAAILADLGRVDAAREWGGRARYSQLVTAFGDVDRRALFARLDHVAAPGPDTMAALGAAFEDLVGAGEARFAGFQYLRAACDCDRLGLPGAAADLRARAEDLLPPRHERTLWELLLGGGGADTARLRGGEVVTFAPEPFVRVGGEAVPLPEGASRLLAVLVAAGGPVPVDRCLEALWPDTAPATGRNRLSQVLFRFRKALGVGRDELVVRRGDMLALEPGRRWRVDAWDLSAAAESGGAPGRGPLPADDFCSALVDVDEGVDGERERLRSLVAGLFFYKKPA